MKDRQYIYNAISEVTKWWPKDDFTLVEFGNILSRELGKIVMLINDFSQNKVGFAQDLRNELLSFANLSIRAINKIDAGDTDFLTKKAKFNHAPISRDVVGVFNEILAERERQDIKHGDKNETLTLQQFGNVLTKEVCEVVTDINDFAKNDYNPKSLRDELIQVAALAVAGIEKIDAGDVAFLYPQAHIYFQLLRAELSFKYSMGVKIKMLGKNTLPAPKIIQVYEQSLNCISTQIKQVQDVGLNFRFWEFWAHDPVLNKSVCVGFVYTDEWQNHESWQPHGFGIIEPYRCYNLACKMVGLIS